MPPPLYNALDNLPRSVIVDTNVICAAALVEDGFSRRALSYLHGQNYSLLLAEPVFDESLKILRGTARRIGWVHDPTILIDSLLQAFGMLVTPPPDGVSYVRGVNRSDQIVARSASLAEGWVLTGDAPLYNECTAANIAARFPNDVLMHRAFSEDNLDISHILRYHPMRRDQGFVFSKLEPGNWCHNCPAGHRFTVIEIESLGTLYYCCNQQSWNFTFVDSATVAVPHRIVAYPPEVVCVSFKWPGKLQLRVRGEDHPAEIKLNGQNPAWSPGQTSFGHKNDKTDHWNGFIRTLVTGPSYLSATRWRALLLSEYGSPNPWDENTLDYYLAQVRITPNPPGLKGVTISRPRQPIEPTW